MTVTLLSHVHCAEDYKSFPATLLLNHSITENNHCKPGALVKSCFWGTVFDQANLVFAQTNFDDLWWSFRPPPPGHDPVGSHFAPLPKCPSWFWRDKMTLIGHFAPPYRGAKWLSWRGKMTQPEEGHFGKGEKWLESPGFDQNWSLIKQIGFIPGAHLGAPLFCSTSQFDVICSIVRLCLGGGVLAPCSFLIFTPCSLLPCIFPSLLLFLFFSSQETFFFNTGHCRVPARWGLQ